MSFEIGFRLKPLAEIAPWGDEGDLRQHWFGLTEGWCWLEVDGVQLLRHSPRWEKLHGDPARFVTRLWEDLLDLLPHALSPLPATVARRLHPPSAWSAWLCRASELAPRGSELWGRYRTATAWWDARRLNTRYLPGPPDVHLWCEDDVHLRWEQQTRVDEGVPVWAASDGETKLPRKEFVDAVTSFHRRFMEAMVERVDEACSRWPRPDVKIDCTLLRAQQSQRAGWIEAALKPAHGPDWGDVERAMSVLDERLAQT